MVNIYEYGMRLFLNDVNTSERNKGNTLKMPAPPVKVSHIQQWKWVMERVGLWIHLTRRPLKQPVGQRA